MKMMMMMMMMKTTKTLNQDSQSPGQELNSGPAEYKVRT
jgi:hypothetical protein